MQTTTIVVLNYNNCTTNIIRDVPIKGDTCEYEKWLELHCGFKADEIAFMVYPQRKDAIPYWFSAEDFD